MAAAALLIRRLRWAILRATHTFDVPAEHLSPQQRKPVPKTQGITDQMQGRDRRHAEDRAELGGGELGQLRRALSPGLDHHLAARDPGRTGENVVQVGPVRRSDELTHLARSHGPPARGRLSQRLLRIHVVDLTTGVRLLDRLRGLYCRQLETRVGHVVVPAVTGLLHGIHHIEHVFDMMGPVGDRNTGRKPYAQGLSS